MAPLSLSALAAGVASMLRGLDSATIPEWACAALDGPSETGLAAALELAAGDPSNALRGVTAACMAILRRCPNSSALADALCAVSMLDAVAERVTDEHARGLLAVLLCRHGKALELANRVAALE